MDQVYDTAGEVKEKTQFIHGLKKLNTQLTGRSQ
jgi:hypothetical protein